ncbi:hypothetical protein [Nocardioides nanhaiensis]|uniref:hypothetical protein n=1 Tax=Nocardioides nanhaiensis TaxID=1476871 RepID=UPI0031EF6A38
MDEDLDVLLHRAAEGDRLAFADFYDATSASAYRLALTVAGDPTAAEQAVVRAYTAAWHHSPVRTRGVSPHGWLLGLVHGSAGEAHGADPDSTDATDSGDRGRGPRGRLRTSHDAGSATRPSRRPGWRIRRLA